MTTFVDHLADVWAELWSGDDDRAAAMLYARGIEWWDVRRGRGTEPKGLPALLAERAAIRANADRFALDVRHVVAGDDAIAVEFVALARDCGAPVAAPGCAWWQLDDEGRIAREQWFWDWARRGPADPALVGHAVRGEGRQHSSEWSRRLAGDLMAAWDESPSRMVDIFCADTVVVDTMGAGAEGVLRGAAAVRAADSGMGPELEERRSTVDLVAGRGPLVAFTAFTLTRAPDGPSRTAPAARVLTLDGHDRVVGMHLYLLPPWPTGARR